MCAPISEISSNISAMKHKQNSMNVLSKHIIISGKQWKIKAYLQFLCYLMVWTMVNFIFVVNFLHQISLIILIYFSVQNKDIIVIRIECKQLLCTSLQLLIAWNVYSVTPKKIITSHNWIHTNTHNF